MTNVSVKPAIIIAGLATCGTAGIHYGYPGFLTALTACAFVYVCACEVIIRIGEMFLSVLRASPVQGSDAGGGAEGV